MKKYHILAVVLTGLMIFNIASPALASRDDQSRDCLRLRRCSDGRFAVFQMMNPE